jgi:hypothetical protein
MKLIHSSTNKSIDSYLTRVCLSSQTHPILNYCRQSKMQKKKNGSVENILSQVYSNYQKYSDEGDMG